MILTLRSQNGFPVLRSLDKCKILIEDLIQLWSNRLRNDGESARKCKVTKGFDVFIVTSASNNPQSQMPRDSTS